MRRALVAALAASALCGALAGSARADTFGSTDMTQALDASAHCPAYPCTLVDQVHGDGSDEAGSPIDGVLTAVRMRYHGDGAAATFRVLRPDDPGEFLNAGPEMAALLPDTAGVDKTLSFAVRRPIEEGDRLGLGAGTSLSGDAYLATGAPRECLQRQGSHPVGTSQAYVSSGCVHEALLQGVVEPDADDDGYGDLTQDGCPADPAIHDGPCSADLSLTASVSPGALTLADSATYTMTIRNLGTSPSSDASLRVPVGDTAQLVSASPSVGRCGGVRAVFCWLGTLDPGDSARVTVVVRPDNPGKLTVRSSTIASTSDPDATNNYAAASTIVTDPFAGVLLPQPKAFVRGRIARVLHACPLVSLRYCEGAATVTRSAPVLAGGPGQSTVPRFTGPRLGRGSFRLQPGAASTISITLSKKTVRTLARRHRLAVVVTALAQNGAGTTRTTFAPVMLVLKRSKHRR